MSRNLVAVTGVAALLGLALACTKSSTPLTPSAPNTSSTSTALDQPTLKASAPTLVSPTGGVKPPSPLTLTLSASTPTFSTAALPPNYRFQIFNSTNVLVEEKVVSSTSYSPSADLVANSSYTWWARAEFANTVGPWPSAKASFIAPENAFFGVSEFGDPLTTGMTVGVQHGGTFIPGQGWQSLSHTDGIDYDLQQPCSDNCKLEFDVTNFGPQEGQPDLKDLKWLSMGDARDFGSFGAFRNSAWKMHLVQRADYPTGMEIVWRNGKDSDGTDPGDHRIKLNFTDITFASTNVYHFVLEWTTSGYSISVNGVEVLTNGWSFPYAPPMHRISLGCYPRGESFIGAIYRNVKLKKN